MSKAERYLLASVDRRALFNASALDDDQKIVRPDFLRALLLGQIAGATVPETGLRTRGLIFEEVLDLRYLSDRGETLPPLHMEETHFKAGALFDDARLTLLRLDKSIADAGLSLRRIRTLGNVWCDRLRCTGELNLMGAEIGGQLSLKGARLKGAADGEGRITGRALSADGAIITGGLYCSPAEGERFEAEGEVRLLGTDIGGEVVLDGCRFKGAVDPRGCVTGPAVSMDKAKVKSGVYCNPAAGHRFEAEGEFRVLGAAIGGHLSFKGASLKGAADPDGRVVGFALSADGAVIGDSLHCDPAEGHRFEAEGGVRLLGIEVGGQLGLKGARIKGAVDEHGRVTGFACQQTARSSKAASIVIRSRDTGSKPKEKFVCWAPISAVS